MSYPYSTSKKVFLNGINKTDALKIFSENSFNENIIVRKEGNSTFIVCNEFSTKMSHLKDLNKGEILITKEGNGIRIECELKLWEHIIFFCSIVVISAYTSYRRGWDIGILQISAILLIAIGVFFYIIPMLAFKSFFDDSIRKIKNINN